MTVTSLPGTPGSLTRIGVTYAIPVIRVSKVGKRGQTTDKLKSTGEQMERSSNGLPMWCPGEHVEIAEWIKEMDVSGYRLTLQKRKGLLRAVEMIEAGAAKILIVAYFNRLCRNGAVKREVVQRVEAAGGRILAIDMGAISHATAAQWLTSEIVLVIEEYYSRQLGERLSNTQKNSIMAGIPIGTIPPGYAKDEVTRRLHVVEAEAEVMREVFKMRADGASLSLVRRYMRRHGIVRSLNSVRKLLHSEAYLGHLVWGKGARQVRNDDSHRAIISRDLFDRVGRIKSDSEQFRAVPGRKSTLLLSGLRVRRCAGVSQPGPRGHTQAVLPLQPRAELHRQDQHRRAHRRHSGGRQGQRAAGRPDRHRGHRHGADRGQGCCRGRPGRLLEGSTQPGRFDGRGRDQADPQRAPRGSRCRCCPRR